MDIPVIAIRSVLDKIHLHDAEYADGVIFHDLSEAGCGVLVSLVDGCNDVELVARSDLRTKCRVDDPDQAKVFWPRISRNRERAIAAEIQHAQTKLPDSFEQKSSRIDRVAGKVPDEHRISAVNEPLSPKPRALQID